MHLVLPSLSYQNSYMEYINELGDEERYPFPLDFDHSQFENMLKKIKQFADGVNLPVGYVQSSTFWLVDGAELLGVTNLRHRLNKQIEHCGGHIGLGIRPSHRGRGLGAKLMKLSIEKLCGMGVKPVHIHCYKDNIPSAKAIIANGGELSSELMVDTKIVQRYKVGSAADNDS